MKLRLAANPAHSVQAENLQPLQNLNQQLVQVVDDGLGQPICSFQLRSG